MTEQTTEPPQTPRSPRRLYRSSSDRKIAGISGGLGDYFGVDPVVFRLAFVFFTVFGGAGLLAYIIAWLVLPSDDGAGRPARSEPPGGSWTGPAIVGGILILAGAVTLLDSSAWFGFDFDGPAVFWPLIFIGGGAWLLLREGPLRSDSADVPETTSLASNETSSDLEPWAAPAVEPAPAPRGPSVTSITLGVLFLYFGVTALGAILDWWEVSAAPVLAAALVITGIGLVVSALLRQGWWLLLVGLGIGAVLFPASLVDVPLGSGVGDRTYAPSSPDEVQDRYEFGVGELIIDLRDAADELGAGDVLDVDADLGIGRLLVVVPEDATLELDLEANLGESVVRLPSVAQTIDNEGFGADVNTTIEGTVDGPIIRIEGDVGIGQVEVSETRFG
ncbi:MAG: PspC domain-containing protein [Actinomycetota bacterium]